jgi:hypothetical protein
VNPWFPREPPPSDRDLVEGRFRSRFFAGHFRRFWRSEPPAGQSPAPAANRTLNESGSALGVVAENPDICLAANEVNLDIALLPAHGT